MLTLKLAGKTSTIHSSLQSSRTLGKRVVLDLAAQIEDAWIWHLLRPNWYSYVWLSKWNEVNFSRSVASPKDLKHVALWHKIANLSYGRIYKLSHHPMSSHVIPCHPTSSHVSFKIELVQCDSRWTFFRPKLHLRNFNLEHFQAESHFEACDKHFGFPVNFWT